MCTRPYTPLRMRPCLTHLFAGVNAAIFAAGLPSYFGHFVTMWSSDPHCKHAFPLVEQLRARCPTLSQRLPMRWDQQSSVARDLGYLHHVIVQGVPLYLGVVDIARSRAVCFCLCSILSSSSMCSSQSSRTWSYFIPAFIALRKHDLRSASGIGWPDV